MVGDDQPDQGASNEPTPAAAPSHDGSYQRSSGDVTQILSAIERGDAQASENLLPLVYNELRKLADAKMAQEKPGQTLQATALVHEAYIRLVDGEKVQRWDSRGHFFAAAATAMRRILVETARRKAGPQAGGSHQRHEFSDVDQVTYPVSDEMLDMNVALTKLGMADPQAAEVVQLRIFGGMTIDQVASYQGVSPRTIKRVWAYARAWLAREIHR